VSFTLYSIDWRDHQFAKWSIQPLGWRSTNYATLIDEYLAGPQKLRNGIDGMTDDQIAAESPAQMPLLKSGGVRSDSQRISTDKFGADQMGTILSVP